jgi:DNA-binding MarR family transcriptional regulator
MPDKNASAINALLEKAGISPETTDVVLTVDAVLQKWRRRAMRRELGHKALIDLKAGIDLAQLDVLIAIEGPEPEFGETEGETMIATVAERLGIDPSRASRVVSEMVERGFARRAVSQADARRTIIELTESGRALVQAVQAYKFLVMGDFFSGWSAEDLDVFLPLLQRFASWSEGMDRSAEKFADDIAELSKSIQPGR